MLNRALFLAGLVAAWSLSVSTGCLGLAAGKVIPGGKVRHRDGNATSTTSSFSSDRVETRTTRTIYGVRGEDVGGGRYGGLVAGRFGIGEIQVGDRPTYRDAGVVDIRLEAQRALTSRVGVGASVGWQLEGATNEGSKVSRIGFPVTLIGSLVPLRPFVVRLGAVVQPGVTVVDEESTSGNSYAAMVGTGVVTQFRGWHFVAGVNWQKAWAGNVATPDGPEAYTSEMFLIDIWVVGW
ncbi:MAG: hypothetical protein IPL79_15800 [Myxococcales bacterium]|nr:hypothetical protein [Myxococcales bacterium]